MFLRKKDNKSGNKSGRGKALVVGIPFRRILSVVEKVSNEDLRFVAWITFPLSPFHSQKFPSVGLKSEDSERKEG